MQRAALVEVEVYDLDGVGRDGVGEGGGCVGDVRHDGHDARGIGDGVGFLCGLAA